MIPILFDKTAHDYTRGWICFLTEAASCSVEEHTTGGEYFLTMKYPVSGVGFAELQTDRLILATHDDYKDLQPFRIKSITKPIAGIVTVYAYHKSYDLTKNTLMPCKAVNSAHAIDALNTKTANHIPFDITSNIDLGVEWLVQEPITVRSAIVGEEGSFVDKFGGEVEWDKDSVRIHANRGQEKNFSLREGVNISDISITESTENAYSGIVPYYKDVDGIAHTLPESSITFLDSYFYNSTLKELYADGMPSEMFSEIDALTDSYGQSITDNKGRELNMLFLRYPRTVPVDLTEEFDMEKEITEADLRNAARTYLMNNATFFFENFSCKINNLDDDGNVIEPLGLCDTVRIYYKKYNATAKKKIVSIKYDVLRDRAEEIEVGYEKSTFASTLVSLIRKRGR